MRLCSFAVAILALFTLTVQPALAGPPVFVPKPVAATVPADDPNATGFTTVQGQLNLLSASLLVQAPYDFNFATQSYRANGASLATLASAPGYTFTRASTGFEDNNNGDLTSFASGVPRITNKGLLIEAAATQLLPNTTSAGFTANSATFTSGQADRAGGTAAFRVTSTGVLGAEGYQAVTLASSSTPYLSAVDFNPAATTAPFVFIQLNDTTNQRVVTFDATTGAPSASLPSGVTAGVISFTNGWKRVWVSRANPGGTSAFGVYGVAGTASTSTTTDGSATTAGQYATFAFPQIEAGTFPTSPIPNTTGSAVTRAADYLTVTTTNTPVGALAASFITPVAATSALGIVAQLSGTDRTDIRNQGGTLQFELVGGGVANDFADGALTANTSYGAAISFSASRYAYTRKGQGAIDSSGSMTSSLATSGLTFGNLLGNTTYPANGYIQRVQLWQTAQSDATLLTLPK